MMRATMNKETTDMRTMKGKGRNLPDGVNLVGVETVRRVEQ